MLFGSHSFFAPTLFYCNPIGAPPTALFNFSSKRIISINNGFRSITPVSLFIPAASLKRDENKEADDFAELKEKVKNVGIICCNSIIPGEYTRLICPKCKGGRSMERSLSFHISGKRNFALWRCFNFECGWAGQVFAHNSTTSDGVDQLGRMGSPRILTEESLNLEPLGDMLAAYFAKRMISKDTLKRNHVMQMAGDQIIIAFTYRQNGILIGCKYRTLEKRFWQEKGTDKVLYGLDDVREADEIIIVEGEIDKLSLEEAGIPNCVSVPNGAPQAITSKELLPPEEDTRFSYLWNCKELLDKASRIVLATDGDLPGQALAEELARRLGRERCWQVCWPKKDEFSSYKDANESCCRKFKQGSRRTMPSLRQLHERFEH
ncbi:primase homolog protein isoform X3 [Nicotiana tomentosiformis]|uniref:Primase homolog protein isoform X2 n=1 Tax=Nicotiana tabacum TaxID=4097 RepID=A0A1S3XB63_TOBAC|nr:PREDICTED: primase homolog protein-like isoform X2 [Nicotiana tabacum]XP_033511659.1 primase homolog protein isoform X2 [Nicotiana tomentosiformis]